MEGVNADIKPDGQGRVHPGSGGLSVVQELSLTASGRRKCRRRLNAKVFPGALGGNNLAIWELGEGHSKSRQWRTACH